MGKGIEVNTAGFKYGLGHPNPTEAVLLRYHELGGEILTLGADAHAPEHVAYAFDVFLRFCGMQASGTLQSLPAESRTSFRFRNSENKGLIPKISK